MTRCRHCSPVPEEVRRAAGLLERRWTVSILWASSEGASRFNELKQAVGEIPPRTLAQRLVELENAELVRQTVQGVPRGSGHVPGAAQFAFDPCEHPGVADLGRGTQGLLPAGAVADPGGDSVDVGAQCPAELGAGLLGVVGGVVVGHEPEQPGQRQRSERGDRERERESDQAEEAGEQRRHGKAEQRPHDLLAVEPGLADLQDGQVLAGRVRPGAAGRDGDGIERCRAASPLPAARPVAPCSMTTSMPEGRLDTDWRRRRCRVTDQSEFF